MIQYPPFWRFELAWQHRVPLLNWEGMGLAAQRFSIGTGSITSAGSKPKTREKK